MEELSEQRKIELRREAWDRALKRLGVREHSPLELAQYLKRRGYLDEIVSPIIQELKDRGWLDEARYTRMMTSHQGKRGKGSRYVLQKLKAKGVQASESQIKAILEESLQKPELAQALEILERRYPNYLSDPNDSRKGFQALVRRGFSPSVAATAIRTKPEGEL